MRLTVGMAKRLRDFLSKLEGLMPSEVYERDQFLKALKQPVSTRATRAKSKRSESKKTKRTAKTLTRAQVRAACAKRAAEICEACQQRPEWRGRAWLELDHFFGRATESVEACWMLCAPGGCHAAKTENNPSAEAWLQAFIEHCQRNGYHDEANRAQSRLAFVKARKFLSEARP